MYIYTGVFFNNETSEMLRRFNSKKLARETKALHVTVLYKPSDAHEELFGSEVEIEVTGYGCNNENEGLSCKVTSENPEMQLLLDTIEVPHITLAVSERGKAVNTRFLDFAKPASFRCKGTYGGFRKEKK